jgi:Cys-tRNA synthase (O-phospho-L-seryl-tRNA:Cys-tRNA synthase)
MSAAAGTSFAELCAFLDSKPKGAMVVVDGTDHYARAVKEGTNRTSIHMRWCIPNGDGPTFTIGPSDYDRIWRGSYKVRTRPSCEA